MKNTRTAGIIIIGNEILSGKVRDANSYFLAGELRELGVDLKRISVIPDDLDLIGQEAVIFSHAYNYVFTSGGVGPTHDDITMAGIAKGFGVDLVENAKIREILQSKYKKQLNDALLKMTKVPEGSNAEYHEKMRFPIVSFKNIYIFPGIPEYIRNKFQYIKEKFRSSAFHLGRIYLNCHESVVAETLNRIVSENGDVVFGSYPVLDQPDYRVIITAESKSEDVLDKALLSLMEALPSDVIVRKE
jgi:molybdenum cofactor synthesis domain-containing protein